MPTRLHYDCLPPIAGPYVHAIRHRGVLYLSGLTAMGTAAEQGSLREQTRAILALIGKVLAQEGRTVSDLIRINMYVCDIGALAELRDVLREFYQGVLPASTLLEVSALIKPELNIEIEATIALEDE
jgi:enamine deaminase RidA (YjgF/YER057c/UK114 family)